MSDIKVQTKAQSITEAEESHLECFFAQPDELFLDLDNGAICSPKVRDCMLRNGISLIGEGLTTVSQSGTGHHVYFRINKPLDYKEAAALQCALGSDPVREMLTILTRDFSALYETSNEAIRVTKWRESFTKSIF